MINANSKGKTSDKHHSAAEAAMKRWNADVKKIDRMFETSYIDLFKLVDAPAKLVNFTTGIVATPSVQDSMIGALDNGMTMHSWNFVSERLVVSEGEKKPQKSLYALMKRANVKTMSVMKKIIKITNK